MSLLYTADFTATPMMWLARMLWIAVLALVWSPVALWANPLSGDIANARFSSDGKMIALTICKPRCLVAVIDRAANSITYYRTKADYRLITPSFMQRDKRLLFVFDRRVGDSVKSGIAAVGLDGSAPTKYLELNVAVRHPIASRNDDRLLFAALEKHSPGRSPSIDLYSLDIHARTTHRITNAWFLTVSRLRLSKDEKAVVFASYVTRYVAARAGIEQRSNDEERGSALLFLDLSSGRISMRRPGLKELRDPVPMAGGEIAVAARINEMEGIKGPFVHDLFSVHGDSWRRLTYLRRFIREFDVTDSGEEVVVVSSSNGYDKTFLVQVIGLANGQTQVIAPTKEVNIEIGGI